MSKLFMLIVLTIGLANHMIDAQRPECLSDSESEKYYQHNNKCYGYKGAPCSDSSECLSSAYTCQSGTCQEAENSSLKGDECSVKNNISVCWIPGTVENRQYTVKAFQYLLGPVEYICHVRKDGLTLLGKLVKSWIHPNACKYIWNGEDLESSDYDLLEDNGRIKWKSDGYTLDKAVFGGFAEDGKPNLICRALWVKYFVTFFGKRSGRLSPPNYDTCLFVRYGKFHERSDYEVLVIE